jgi:hypothetical protein
MLTKDRYRWFLSGSGTHLISLSRVDSNLLTSISIENSMRPGKQRQKSSDAVGGNSGDNYHGQITGSVVGGQNHKIIIVNSPPNGEPCSCTYHFDIQE